MADDFDLTELRRMWAQRRSALRAILARIDARGLVRPARDAAERAWPDERGESRPVEDEALARAAEAYYARRYRR